MEATFRFLSNFSYSADVRFNRGCSLRNSLNLRGFCGHERRNGWEFTGECKEYYENGSLKDMVEKRILVTGSAGFIGFHLANKLLEGGHDVIGYDNVNDYYDPKLKEARLFVLNDYNYQSTEPILTICFKNYSLFIVLNTGLAKRL